MLYAELETSSDNYKIGIDLTFINNDTSHKQCTVTIQPLLKYVGPYNSITRYQHHWHVHFAVDSVYKHTDSYVEQDNKHSRLPNNDTAPGVESAGYLTMVKGTWYKWGTPYTYILNNDDAKHNCGVCLYCIGTQPQNCPSYLNGSERYLWAEFTLPRYTEPAPPVRDAAAVFNPKTRQVSYSWNTDAVPGTTWLYVKVWSNWWTKDGQLKKSDWVYVNENEHLINQQLFDGKIKETIPKEIDHIVYQITNVSYTWDTTLSDVKQISTAVTDSKVWVKVNNAWKKATPWVKVGNIWKKATKVYVKTSGGWKTTIT